MNTFMCIATTEDIAHILTPKVMHWDENIWLMDLTSCRAYWEVCATRRGMGTEEFLRTILQGEQKNRPFAAALAPHPWQALLLVLHMQTRKLDGLLNSAFTAAFFQQMDWDTWLRGAERIAAHLITLKTPRFQRTAYKQQCKRLKVAMMRLHFRRPAEFVGANAPAMKRRFGGILARLWEWTYPSKNQWFEPDVLTNDFPWIDWHPPEKPRLKRHLDFPLSDWQPIEPLLVEDFDQLCHQTAGERERVVEMNWRITLQDLSVRDIIVAFRHPHHLQSERGHHKTAILQTQFAFAAAQREIAKEQEDFIPLIHWEWIIEKRMTMPPRVVDLLGDPCSTDEAAELLRLENQLPVPLVQFALCQDWVPEDSFKRTDGATALQDGHSVPWIQLAKKRPMFFYASPKPGEFRDQKKTFIERTSTKWWRHEEASLEHHYRDYYQSLNGSHCSQWIFQDAQGKWYLHGVFG